MDQEYKRLHEEARRLLFRYQDVIDQPNHPTAQAFRRELQRLEDDIQSSKNPRSIESLIVAMQRQVKQIEDAPEPIMNPGHADDFHDRLEDMRQDIRRHPKY